MRVLLAIVTPDKHLGTCTIGFSTSMLRLQQALQQAPQEVDVQVELAASLHEAITLAHDDARYDAVVALNSRLGFPPSFVLRALVSPWPFVAGVYPLPRIDWERVVAKTPSTEDPKCRGNVYNIDAQAAKPKQDGYWVVPRAGLDAVVLKREALEALAGSHRQSEDELCATWGKDVWVDMENPCHNFGPVEFMGCVGARAVLR